MLVVLARIDDISVYRAIESLSKTDSPLKKWAVIALQQSRMLIQSTLMDTPGIFISTGLGGQNGMLRYFCVFLYRNPGTLLEFQHQIICNEITVALKPYKGILEQIDFFEDYCTLHLLFPLNADLKSIFEKTIDECNLYGNFLQRNMIITNVKKLSEEEIKSILQKKKWPPLPESEPETELKCKIKYFIIFYDCHRRPQCFAGRIITPSRFGI